MEETALYRPILKKAWQTTKKFKNLWFFGLFVAILGMSGEYEILSRAFFNPLAGEKGMIISLIDSVKDGWLLGIAGGGLSWSNIWGAISSNPQSLVFVILIIIVTVAIALFFIWLSIVSQIGIIINSDLNHKNKNTTINKGIDFGIKNFWPVLLSDVILKIVLFIVFLILGKEVLALGDQGIFGLIIYYISFVILVVAIFTASFLIRYQILYFILQQKTYLKSFSSAWKLFQNNWLISLEMAFILFLFYLLAATATSIIALIFVATIMVLILYFTVSLWIIIIMSTLLFIIALAVALIITAVLNTFQWSSWILLFNRLAKSENLSKVIRLANFYKS